MDRLVLASRLESLRRCVQRIVERRPDSLEALEQDADLQDILSVNLTRAVQLCVDIALQLLSETEGAAPGTMAESFRRLAEQDVIPMALADRLRAAVGFRNIAVHQYQQIDWAIVHSICHEHLDDFREFARIASSALDADR